MLIYCAMCTLYRIVCPWIYLLFLPVCRLYSLWQGKKRDEQPQTDLSEDIRMTCTQFTKYHKQQCFQEIVKKRR